MKSNPSANNSTVAPRPGNNVCRSVGAENKEFYFKISPTLLSVFRKHQHGTCDDPGVEVERHLAAVLEDDGLHQVAVPLQPDLVSLAPLPGVHQTCSNHHINMQRRLLESF